MNTFKFIPSVSAEYLMAGITNNKIFENGMLYDYYNYDGEFNYPYFLITAGHFYKKDVAEKCKFFKKDGVEIFGDSGGFQISTGALKWSKEIRHDIMTWLERNSTIAANLDIPLRSKLFSTQEARSISYDNFKYFNENQTGATKFLNVLQVKDYDTAVAWYEMVKEFKDFHGWCIGGCGGNTTHSIISTIYILLKNKEHLRSKIIHYLGVSSPLAFLLLSHLQNSLNKLGCDIQVYSDSSSPNAARFGTYYADVNLKTLAWNQIHVPYLRTDTIDDLDKYKKEIFASDSNSVMPLFNNFDEKIFTKLFSHSDVIDFNERFLSAMIMRNIYAYKYEVERLSKLSLAPEYYRQAIFNKEVATLGTLINNMVEVSDSANELDKLYNKNVLFLNQFSKVTSANSINHDFF